MHGIFGSDKMPTLECSECHGLRSHPGLSLSVVLGDKKLKGSDITVGLLHYTTIQLFFTRV